VKNIKGDSLTGVVGITFALHSEQTGGAPLWMETQNVTADSSAHYTALLGATLSDGLPQKITDGSFTIKTSKPGVEVSWQVTTASVRTPGLTRIASRWKWTKRCRIRVTISIPSYSGTRVSRASRKCIIPGHRRQRNDGRARNVLRSERPTIRIIGAYSEVPADPWPRGALSRSIKYVRARTMRSASVQQPA
jgi:hypothetical protein